MKQRYRVGIKLSIPFFPNMGIFILHLMPIEFEKIRTKVEELKILLTLTGYSKIAGRFIAEEGEKK